MADRPQPTHGDRIRQEMDAVTLDDLDRMLGAEVRVRTTVQRALNAMHEHANALEKRVQELEAAHATPSLEQE